MAQSAVIRVLVDTRRTFVDKLLLDTHVWIWLSMEGRQIAFSQSLESPAAGIAQMHFGDFVLGTGQTGRNGKNRVQHPRADLDAQIVQGV